MRDDPHSRNLRRHRIVAPEICYSVTTTVDGRSPRLEGAAPSQVVIDSLAWLREAKRIALFGFVVMPDHLHVLLAPSSGTVLPDVMKQLKGFTSRKLNALLRRTGRFWQDGYYEHAIRDPTEAFGALKYLHENPVRAGLVVRAEQFSASSAHPRHRGMLDPIA